MTEPTTLLQMAGADQSPSPLDQSALVLIDCQMEYVDGRPGLDGIAPALENAARVLARARDAGTPVIHVAHQGAAGGLFDPDGPGGAIAAQVAPRDGEVVIGKKLPNAFAGTDLAETLTGLGRKQLVLVGFMTHMCVSSTARVALDLGYRSTIVAGATATRDLPAPGGGVMTAAELQRASLAALADRFAVIAQGADDLPG